MPFGLFGSWSGSWKRWAFWAGVFVSAIALGSEAPASADPTDAAFVAALAKDGISMPGPGNAIATAHGVCAGLDSNESSSVLAVKLMKQEDLSAKQSGYFIGLSVAAYCPENKGKTGDTSVTWLLPLPPLM
jgi:Protein of unknown function (DUF732)